MKDYRGYELAVGDTVAIYWGYNELKTAKVAKVSKNGAKVLVNGVLSKWKRGECMVKLEEE